MTGVLLLAVFVVIERRAEHPLLPFRILTNRTRGTAFATMAIVPAAMFSMFFFLSLFVQNVMGYSPLQTGVAFLPFSFGLVIAATIASRLVNSIDPRWIAGTGTALAGAALLGFSRLTIDASPGHLLSLAASGGNLGGNVSYWTDIFPFIVLMSLGMGATFVPMTLAAVHGVNHRDSGVGSGVLNTMQQVGGALGLATLSTVAVHFAQAKTDQLVPALHQLAPQLDPSAVSGLAGLAGFTTGAAHAFLTGAFMIWTASVIVWIFLNVKHEEMATDGAPEGVGVA